MFEQDKLSFEEWRENIKNWTIGLCSECRKERARLYEEYSKNFDKERMVGKC